MLTAVFATQSIGTVLAFAVNLGGLHNTNSAWALSIDKEVPNSKLVVDQVWRWTIGVGVLPASFAILFRLTIPETPQYYAGIMKDLGKAIHNLLKVYRNRTVDEHDVVTTVDASTSVADKNEADRWYRGTWNYLKGPGKPWKRLLPISFLWGIMDIVWYGLSEGSPSLLSTLAHGAGQNLAAIDLYHLNQRRDGYCPSEDDNN
ncbi:uncharacterized protein JN550_011592 [Neoarthrinium moseri]|uniref:uncharacterized protein n=1 Tax=Neoarthrinium moseri TaxID=1658444 RepID=UPI001FDDA355|nr:uncharacterized protein JN550_011592 [Neoarthrinium moseri]KAI1860326.1 hypothetical protein JN550_011592 [Neoarthrinium moseri]